MRAEGAVAAARTKEDRAMENREYVHTESCARSEILLCLTLALHTRIRQQQRGPSMELVLRDLWSRRSGLNGTTCHRLGPETYLTDSYKGGQPPCTIPTKGAHPLRAPQVVRSMNGDAHSNAWASLSGVTSGAGDPD